jgi:hypothetical protein
MVNVDVVSEPTALKPLIAPVDAFNDAPAGKLPDTSEYVTAPSASVALTVTVLPR